MTNAVNSPIKRSQKVVSTKSCNDPEDTLYYDGQCPLCAKEMAKLRALMDDRLILKDIHTLTSEEPTDPNAGIPDKDTLLRVLHLQRNGTFLTGIDANIAAWEHTTLGYLWRWMRWPIIRPWIEWGYSRWAQWRYNRLYK